MCIFWTLYFYAFFRSHTVCCLISMMIVLIYLYKMLQQTNKPKCTCWADIWLPSPKCYGRVSAYAHGCEEAGVAGHSKRSISVTSVENIDLFLLSAYPWWWIGCPRFTQLIQKPFSLLSPAPALSAPFHPPFFTLQLTSIRPLGESWKVWFLADVRADEWAILPHKGTGLSLLVTALTQMQQANLLLLDWQFRVILDCAVLYIVRI